MSNHKPLLQICTGSLPAFIVSKRQLPFLLADQKKWKMFRSASVIRAKPGGPFPRIGKRQVQEDHLPVSRAQLGIASMAASISSKPHKSAFLSDWRPIWSPGCLTPIVRGPCRRSRRNEHPRWKIWDVIKQSAAFLAIDIETCAMKYESNW